jgi:hypothetical protein
MIRAALSDEASAVAAGETRHIVAVLLNELKGEAGRCDAWHVRPSQVIDEVFDRIAAAAGIDTTVPLPAIGDDANDVVIIGVETSQWIGERFAADLRAVFPGLKVGAVSANKILGDEDGAKIGADTTVIAVSQSGQTFPTLNATIKLEKASPGRTFVVTGEWDTLMGLAVGQKYGVDAEFGGRIICNNVGFRPSEAVSLAAAANQATLTELLMRISKDLREVFPNTSPYGMTLGAKDIAKLEAKRDAMIAQAENIVGVGTNGKRLKNAQENRSIAATARRWAQHVLDTPITAVITRINLYVTVVVGFAVFPWLASFLPVGGALAIVVGAVAAAFQAAHYDVLPWVVAMIRRKLQGREPFVRLGKRTIVVADVPWVHQSLEMFVSKLNSLSKASVAVDVHGANPTDHLVHRFAHRVVRGSLIWLGVPDGRVSAAAAKRESAALMSAKQAKGIRNFGIGPEVVSVGYDRPHNPNATDTDLSLGHVSFTTDKQVLGDLYENRFDSLLRLVAGQVFFHDMMRRVSMTDKPTWFQKIWPWAWKIHRTQSGTAIATTAAPVSGAVEQAPEQEKPLVQPELKEVLVAEALHASSSAVRDVGGIDMSSVGKTLSERSADGVAAKTVELSVSAAQAGRSMVFAPKITKIVRIDASEFAR